MLKDLSFQCDRIHWVPRTMADKRPHWGTSLWNFRTLKIKKVLKASWDTNKVGFYKGSAIKIASDCSIKYQTLEENRARYQNPEAKWFQPRIMYSVQLSIKCWREVKTCLDIKIYFSWHKLNWEAGWYEIQGVQIRRVAKEALSGWWKMEAPHPNGGFPEGGLREEMKRVEYPNCLLCGNSKRLLEVLRKVIVRYLEY